MKKAIILFCITILLLFTVVLSCSPRKEVIPLKKLEDGTVKQPALIQMDWQQDWEKILAAAQKEGRVTVWSTAGAETRSAIVKEFKNKYNIDVEWITGRPSEMQARLAIERKAGLYTVDLIQAGGGASFWMKNRDFLLPLDKILILPEVKDVKYWYKNRLPWIDDKDFTIIAYGSQIVRFVAINTQEINPGEIKDVRDLLDPKWKGKISLNDPSIGGVGLKTFGVLGEWVTGWGYFQALAKQDPLITSDTRLQVDWLARGRYPIALSARPESMVEFKKAGASVEYLDVKDGSYITSGGATQSLINKAPHPNAAALFTNWFLGKEGQTIYSKLRAVESFRLEVPNNHLDVIRDPKVDYIAGDTEEAFAKEDGWAKKAKDIFSQAH